MSVSRRAKVAGEKEQGAQGEVSLGLTQRSLEVGTGTRKLGPALPDLEILRLK